ncbi:MAG: hypothetical protein IJA57_08390 [Alistipes sp.]|nr:hypothetical protein [Alistipes sp.]
MKQLIYIICAVLLCIPVRSAAWGDADSLLVELDKAIANRMVYVDCRRETIDSLKLCSRAAENDSLRYYINEQVIDAYNSFHCDSAVRYIVSNIAIAESLGDHDKVVDSRLRLAANFSVSGLFLQAEEIFNRTDFESLKVYQKTLFCWSKIRYYEQLQKYSNNPKFAEEYALKVDNVRDTLMTILSPGSELYKTEEIFKLQYAKRYNEALDISLEQFGKTEPNTHGYAMKSMLIASIYRQLGNREKENHYLALAAITDVKLAVKENEALLLLASNLSEAGDIERAYNYIKSALDDSNFYNSRFKSTVIARMWPIIESNYMARLKVHNQILAIGIVVLSLLVSSLAVLVFIVRKQRNAIASSRESIRAINAELCEAHFVKEQYISYFMKQCSDNINKLHLFRKEVNHKIKNKQAEQLYKPSNKELERDIEELMRNFDEAFLNICPRFIQRFNALLIPEARYTIEDKRLNTELRIFALMRLGITNIAHIAEFLQCSPQTIYNYKSKIKSKTLHHITNLEEEISKMRLTIPQMATSEFTE